MYQQIKGKYRNPGIGCITRINDRLWEGYGSPKTIDPEHLCENRIQMQSETEALIQEIKAETVAL